MQKSRATENLGAQLTSSDCQVTYAWTYILHQLEPDPTLDHGCSDGEVHLQTYLMQQGPGLSEDV